MRSQRIGHDLATEQQQQYNISNNTMTKNSLEEGVAVSAVFCGELDRSPAGCGPQGCTEGDGPEAT